MQLESLRVSSSTGLCVNISSFHPLTLLVGVSGSGKSQILTYIMTLFQLLQGLQAPQLEDGEYELRFKLRSDHYHYWVYMNEHRPSLIHLWKNDEVMNETTLSPDLLPTITPIQTINEVRSSHTLTKRFLLATPLQQEEIISLFQFIFDSIDTIEVKCSENAGLQLFFKETNGNWLNLYHLSDGMLKSFYYLTELVLIETGSLLLIDEFENGLGLNCMGPLLEQMLTRDDLQLILSSHHPYIINNIPSESWSIITRDQSNIHVQSAQDFGIGQTKYDAFFELMNRLEFEGVL